MTAAEWSTLRVGDYVVERSGARRRVLSLSRVGTRVAITLSKLRRTVWTPKSWTTYFNSDDIHGERWRLERQT